MTTKQIKAFWVAFGAACRELGLTTKPEQETYRRAVMRQEAAAEHLKDVSPTTGYEAVMMRLKADANDFEGAAALSAGDERRIGAIIADATRQAFELSGKSGNAVAYVRGILEQSGLIGAGVVAGPSWYMDYPDATPMRIFQMIDTHRRRLLWRREEATGVHLPVRYRYGTHYVTIKTES